MSAIELSDILLFVPVGAALGAAYFFLLYRTLPRGMETTALRAFLPHFLLRFALAGGVFWVIAQQGAVPLLLALAGFVLARAVTKRLVPVE